MFSTYLLFGEPDWQGMLAYAVIFFGSLLAFVLVVRLIYVKVFRPDKETVKRIFQDEAKGLGDERR